MKFWKSYKQFLVINMCKVRGNYSSCTCRSSENIFVSWVQALMKRKDRSKPDQTQFGTKSGVFLSLAPSLKGNVHFCRYFYNLTRLWTKFRVLVLRFSDFMENSILLLSTVRTFILFLKGTFVFMKMHPINVEGSYAYSSRTGVILQLNCEV